jgi:hypothetical protein
MTSNTDTHPSDPPQTKTKHTTQKTKMTSNTDTHPSDPPETKTKHTTQKTFSFLCCVFCFCLWEVRVAYHFSFLCCVFCFCLLGVCVAYHFNFLCSQHRKLKW